MELPFFRTWWIDPGKIIGGRFPGTQDPDESRQMIADLLKAGVRTIVNLQSPEERGRGGQLFPDYRPVVADLVKHQNIQITCHRFPIRDLDVPSQQTMAKILETIRKAIDSGQLVYVHCWGGHGRTGTVAGCWLVDQGKTPDEALKMMKQRRSHDAHLAKDHAPQTDEQRKFIESWHVGKTAGSTKTAIPNSAPTATADPLYDRAIGSLLGLAAGDAVGTTVEFQTLGSFPLLIDMVGAGPFNLKAGEWTDDTSMALCLAESLIERGFFDPVDQLTRYVRWWKEGHFSVKDHCFDIGNQVKAALTDHISTAKPFCGPTQSNNAGNGSLMRLCPVAIAYLQSPTSAIVHAAQSSRTTHGNAECVDACRYFAGLLVGAMRGVSKDMLLSEMYCPVPGLWASESLQPKVATIAGGSFKTRRPPQIKGTGYVIDCLESALWAFHTTGSFEDAILRAANLGDDADTTAAVCGQIAGAFYGASAIPAKWLAKLAMREMIEGLALSLLQLSRSL